MNLSKTVHARCGSFPGGAASESLLELVNKSLIITGMQNRPFAPGRRARQIVPGIAVEAALPAPQLGLSDDARLFLLSLAGGLVFFGTFFG